MTDDPFRAERDELENVLGSLDSVVTTLGEAQFDAGNNQQASRRLSHAVAHINSAMSLIQFSQDKLTGDDAKKERVLK